MSINIGASQPNGWNIGASQTDPASVSGWPHDYNSVANDNIATINGVPIANIKKVNKAE